MAALSEVKDNNSAAFDNSSSKDFHSEGELKRTAVTLNQKWEKTSSRATSGGSISENVGESAKKLCPTGRMTAMPTPKASSIFTLSQQFGRVGMAC